MLLFFRQEKRNRELMVDYFFEEFASSPEQLVRLVQYVRNLIRGSDDDEIRLLLAQRYLEILNPLCRRFGIYDERNTLDDICFAIIDPLSYQGIYSLLKAYKKRSQNLIRSVKRSLDKLLKEQGYEVTVKGRYKSLYSIYRKLQFKPNKRIERLHDIFAFRIVLRSNEIGECFEVMNLLHNTYEPVPRLFKDYITVPKINGYQSIHTGLNKIVSQLDRPIEVQIRTREMDVFAEQGAAAHWIYSEQKSSLLINEKEKKLLDYFDHLSQQSHHQDEVYCFSYEGDVFCLDAQDTLTDFADQIHSSFAKKSQYALVNDQEQQMDYEVKTGDRIQLIMN